MKPTPPKSIIKSAPCCSRISSASSQIRKAQNPYAIQRFALVGVDAAFHGHRRRAVFDLPKSHVDVTSPHLGRIACNRASTLFSRWSCRSANYQLGFEIVVGSLLPLPLQYFFQRLKCNHSQTLPGNADGSQRWPGEKGKRDVINPHD